MWERNFFPLIVIGLQISFQVFWSLLRQHVHLLAFLQSETYSSVWHMWKLRHVSLLIWNSTFEAILLFYQEPFRWEVSKYVGDHLLFIWAYLKAFLRSDSCKELWPLWHEKLMEGDSTFNLLPIICQMDKFWDMKCIYDFSWPAEEHLPSN